MSLIPRRQHPSWDAFLTEDVSKLLSSIETAIGEDYSPIQNNVLRFLETDFSNIKIVILGQDPYPEKGRATGRAFEVGDLNTWDQPFRQVSLKNIVRLIYKTINKIEQYEHIPKFSEIVNEIKSGEFPFATPSQLFKSLEEQGVLFLNTSFTVYPGKPLSHFEIWQPFTNRLISWISNEEPNLSWFLWGKNAIAYKALIESGKFYESRHPMMCSAKYPDDFLKNKCIYETMDIINWIGDSKI